MGMAVSSAWAEDLVGLGNRYAASIIRQAAEEFRKSRPDICVIVGGDAAFARRLASGDIQFGMALNWAPRGKSDLAPEQA
jgi:hypothetical protein